MPQMSSQNFMSGKMQNALDYVITITHTNSVEHKHHSIGEIVVWRKVKRFGYQSNVPFSVCLKWHFKIIIDFSV